MDEPEIEHQLRQLSETEARILFLKCNNYDYEAIGNQLGYSMQWVQLYASSMYSKLGFEKEMHPRERKKILVQKYCPVILKLWNEKTPWPPDEPHPTPSFNALLVVQQEHEFEEEEKRLTKSPPKEIIVIPRTVDQRVTRAFPWALMVALIAIIGIGAYLIGKSTVPLSPLMTQTPLPTYTLQPTLAPQVLLITTTPIPISSNISVSSTATSEPTITQVPTPVEKILFFDEFKDGVSNQIRIEGDYAVVGGSLTSQGPIVLTLGSDSWTDYSVEIVTRFDLCNTYGYFGVRAVSFSNMMTLIGNPCQMRWAKIVNGGESNIPNTDSVPNGPQGGEPFIIDISVQGNTYKTPWIQPMTISGYSSGKVVIKSLGGIRIDSIKVVDLK